MAVNYAQVEELYEIIRKVVDLGELMGLFKKLRKSKAYEGNKSFRETVDRLEFEGHKECEEMGVPKKYRGANLFTWSGR